VSEKDEIKEKIKRIHDVLPKLDDQLCGYKTCGQFARAVAEGRAPCYGCVSGGREVAEKVCDIMGMEVPERIHEGYPAHRPVGAPGTRMGMGRARGVARGPGRGMSRGGRGMGRGFGRRMGQRGR
jgi:Na+-translocating ferredoxin:NAD+ oxidoreductase RNF subunit RnfB